MCWLNSFGYWMDGVLGQRRFYIPVNPPVFLGIVPYFTLLSCCKDVLATFPLIKEMAVCIALAITSSDEKSFNLMKWRLPEKGDKKKNTSMWIQGQMNVKGMEYL